MKTHGKLFVTSFLAAALGAAASGNAAVINLTDQSLTPDGTNAVLTDYVNINTPNGGSNVLSSSPSTAYFITTFTWGAGSNAHMTTRFNFDAPGDANDRNRIGVTVNDDGLVQSDQTGNGFIDYDSLTGEPKRTTFDLGQDMAGQTVTLLVKLSYNNNTDFGISGSDNGFSELYNATSNGTNPTTGDDTLMNVWVNPTLSSVEGSGPSAGDLYALWNASNFKGFKQIIENQSTLETAGDSSITNTTILTGTDATFANALAVATIPEPSAALLGALGFLALLRRRR